MPRLYPYVGPPRLAAGASEARTGFTVTDRAALAAWARAAPEWEGDRLTVTFVLLEGGVLRVAPRRSEHVECARGAPVVAAGELVLQRAPALAVVAASNQSTGYCPDPGCWASVRAALRALEIPAPEELTLACVFRRCPACGELNLVKEGWYVCDLCGADLPEDEGVGVDEDEGEGAA